MVEKGNEVIWIPAGREHTLERVRKERIDVETRQFLLEMIDAKNTAIGVALKILTRDPHLLDAYKRGLIIESTDDPKTRDRLLSYLAIEPPAEWSGRMKPYAFNLTEAMSDEDVRIATKKIFDQNSKSKEVKTMKVEHTIEKFEDMKPGDVLHWKLNPLEDQKTDATPYIGRTGNAGTEITDGSTRIRLKMSFMRHIHGDGYFVIKRSTELERVVLSTHRTAEELNERKVHHMETATIPIPGVEGAFNFEYVLYLYPKETA